MASSGQLEQHRHPNLVFWAGSPTSLGFSPIWPPLLGAAGVPELLLELLDAAGALPLLVPEGCTVTSTRLASACLILASFSCCHLLHWLQLGLGSFGVLRILQLLNCELFLANLRSKRPLACTVEVFLQLDFVHGLGLVCIFVEVFHRVTCQAAK